MPIVGALALIMSGVAALTSLALVEDKGNAKFQKGLVAAHEEAERARALAKGGVLPEGGLVLVGHFPAFGGLLDRQADPAALVVDREHDGLDVLADRHDLLGVVDAAASAELPLDPCR